MPPALGHLAYLGLGNEAAWGTAVARTKFPIGAKPTLSAQLMDPVRISDSFRGQMPARHTRGVKHGEVEAPLEANYIGDEFLIWHLFGGVAGAVVTTLAGTLAYQHAFALTKTLGPGLSAEVEKDQQAYLYAGCKVAGATYSYKPGEPVMKTFRLIGKDESIVSATSPTYPTYRPVKFDHIVCEVNDVAIELKEAELVIDTGLLWDRPQMGSRNTLEANRGRMSITLKLVLYFADDTYRLKFRGNTAMKVELIATDDVDSIEAGQRFTDHVTMPIVQITHPAEPIAGPEYIEQTLECIVFDSTAGAMDALTETLKTTTATVP